MHVVVPRLFLRVLLAGQSDQTLVVDEDAHRLNHRRQQHIDPKVVLVLLVQRGFADVLLNHVRCFFNDDFRRVIRSPWPILLGRVVALLLLQVLVEGLILPFEIRLNSFFQLFDLPGNENTLALAARFGLDDEHDGRVGIGLLLRIQAVFNFGVTHLGFPLKILLDLVEVARVEPRMWEELVVVGELFAEAAQVHAEGVLAAQVVHAEEVVDSLVWVHLGQKVRMNPEVLPPDVPRDLTFGHLAKRHRLLFAECAVVGDQLDGVELGVGGLVVERGQHSSESHVIHAQASKNLVLRAFKTNKLETKTGDCVCVTC